MLSIGLHVAVLVLCFFWLAWQPPDPPLPVYGIEVNLGNVEAGSGDQQLPEPQTSPSEEAVEDEPSEEATELMEETSAEPVEETTPSDPADSYDTDMPPVEEEKKREETTQPKEEPQKEPKENQKPSKNTNQNQTKNEQPNNNGDQPNKTGDQGDPEGDIDSKALYGNPGSQSGASLDMAGWKWEREPRPKDESDETGRIVFKVTINDEGDILEVKPIEQTVSPSVVKVYENEVRRLSFIKTRENVAPAPFSTGKITFIIRSR